MDRVDLFSRKTMTQGAMLALAFALSSCAALRGGDHSSSVVEPVKTEAAPAAAAADLPAVVEKSKEMKTMKIEMKTSMGTIKADLYPEEAPKTVENFVTLAKKGFFEGIIFHRVIPGFMVQTGDPTGTGMGGPGYSFKDEFSKNLRHTEPGMFSMANSGPNTNGSQFFITVAATPWLDNKHSIFGKVTEGMDVVEKIVSVKKDGRDKPVTPVKIEKVTIAE